ncbi:conserved hypothetical protein [Ancylobacter novellus DSM 506]|uniref:Uncharacterized protein n=1 Tax=Ancylobacter novellus (strain ATCC 8093 / DSM 506 / JCM 20403 / CCM 1077 / IAM 12100 / NBRC 12443 / NCIMB 10456) TaxID=639283 RepID=D7A8D6_ANCN5|nr:hypothetical protein [Ancylobacter novellus]ADH88609.1 conserved hypothetical protein [Ancylobacter novellus DSM 506]
MGSRLSDYPYVTVRVHCPRCERYGAYKLARLAACYGPEIELAELVRKLSSDCHHRRENHPYRQGCQARLLDWPRNRPPDEPLATFAVVKGGKS